MVALNGALFVNAAILMLAAAVFFKRGIVVNEIQQAHLLLAPLLGHDAGERRCSQSRCFAPGNRSTLTGTMAGQIVMEGFLNFRMRPWLRRLITRMVAIVPAALTVWSPASKAPIKLLILSQVISEHAVAVRGDSADPFHQRPRQRMGEFANKLWVKVLAWVTRRSS